jgi:rubrerythrin
MSKTAEHKELIEAIEAAIEKEQVSQVFYTKAAGLAIKPGVKVLFRELKADEVSHERMLKNVLLDLHNGKLPHTLAKTIPKDLLSRVGLNFFSKRDIPKTTTNLKQALKIAIKREEDSWEDYSTLAQVTLSQPLKDLFSLLAQVEAGHLRRLEQLYERDFEKER